MAKRQRSGGVKLRRSCGAMAAHMALLERYPSFRLAQMRLEGAVDKRRKAGVDLAKIKLVTIKTVVNVVYRTDEENISDAQIASQIKAMNKDFRAANSDKSQTPPAWKGLVTDSRIQFKLTIHARRRPRRASRATTPSRRPAASRRSIPSHEHLGVRSLVGCWDTHSSPVGQRPATAWSSTIRRWDERHRDGATSTGPHGDARDRPLPRPASHLGRYTGLQRLGPGGGHARRRPNFGMPTFPVITCNNGPNGDMFMNYGHRRRGHVHVTRSKWCSGRRSRPRAAD